MFNPEMAEMAKTIQREARRLVNRLSLEVDDFAKVGIDTDRIQLILNGTALGPKYWHMYARLFLICGVQSADPRAFPVLRPWDDDVWQIWIAHYARDILQSQTNWNRLVGETKARKMNKSLSFPDAGMRLLRSAIYLVAIFLVFNWVVDQSEPVLLYTSILLTTILFIVAEAAFLMQFCITSFAFIFGGAGEAVIRRTLHAMTWLKQRKVALYLVGWIAITLLPDSRIPGTMLVLLGPIVFGPYFRQIARIDLIAASCFRAEFLLIGLMTFSLFVSTGDFYHLSNAYTAITLSLMLMRTRTSQTNS